MYRIILAGSQQEAAAYARDQGWHMGTYRIPAKASTIKGLQVAEIHEFPSFEARYDRHAIRATMRFARKIKHFYHNDTPEWPANYPDPDQGALDFGWVPLIVEAPARDEEEGDDLSRLDSDYDAIPSARATKTVVVEAPKPYEPIGAFAI